MDYKLSHEPRKPLDEVHEDIQELLRECWAYMNQGNPAELERLSQANEELPMLMADFGWYLAQVESDTDEAKDKRDAYLDQEALKLMKQIDPDTDKVYTDTKAQKIVKTGEEYKKFNETYRNLERSRKVINRKYNSLSKSFDGMRSRLSVIKRDSSENT